MNKLWVVEVKYIDDTWGICDFGLNEYSSTDYYKAHEMKRKQQKHLQTRNKTWYKNCFRVRKYVAIDSCLFI